MATTIKKPKAPSVPMKTPTITPTQYVGNKIGIGKGTGKAAKKTQGSTSPAPSPSKATIPSLAKAETIGKKVVAAIKKGEALGSLMNVVDVPIYSISRYPGNPRRNAHAVPAIQASLREFGWQQPIVVDKHNVIIVGDTRYQAALAEGYEMVPVQVAKHLTDAQVIAYRLADNRVGEISEWNETKLLNELKLIADDKFDLKAMGFTDEELGILDVNAKIDQRFLEDFEVMPKAKPKFILISAPEDECALVMNAINQLKSGHKLLQTKMEYSGEPSASKYEPTDE